jgi:hypothetical protein
MRLHRGVSLTVRIVNVACSRARQQMRPMLCLAADGTSAMCCLPPHHAIAVPATAKHVVSRREHYSVSRKLFCST